jgi:RNA recognition motif-containing protein
MDGRSKGCGIVEFATPDEAQRAITELNDTELMGRMVFVREDRESR